MKKEVTFLHVFSKHVTAPNICVTQKLIRIPTEKMTKFDIPSHGRIHCNFQLFSRVRLGRG